MRQDAQENRERGVGMTRAQFAVMLVVVAVVLTATGCAQEAEAKVPDGWVVSPENEKAEGEAGYRILHEETGIELLYVPGGTFMMGSVDDDPDALRTEKPQHAHAVDAFWIGRTEVTIGQWRSVLGSVPGHIGPDDHRYNDQGDDHPVVMVSWDQATEFCGKLGLGLPTEAQWEYAARGPESRVYPWGNEWDETKCCNGRNRGPGGSTFPAGSFPQGASWCGALDMAGNVWEWCAEWYAPVYTSYAQGNFTPPSTGPWRVLRGGDFFWSDPRDFRCAYRDHYITSEVIDRNSTVGFRCARGL